MATNREAFNGIAESWFRMRHWSRFRSELTDLAKRWKGGKLLNIGCAHGPDFLPFVSNFELWGIDFSEEMINQAKKYAMKFAFSPHLSIADAISLPFADGAFDYAIAIAVYHHIKGGQERMAAFSELRRVMKPGGEAFVTVWNRWQPGFWLKSKEAEIPWKSKGHAYQRYHYLYSCRELSRLLQESGFQIIRMFPEYSFTFPVKWFSRNICVMLKNA